MLLQKLQSTFPSEFRRWRIIGGTLIAVETVIGRIKVHRQFGMRLLEILDGSNGDVLIAFPEMKHHGAARLFGLHARNSAAIVANGCAQTFNAGRRKPREAPAEAEP